MPVKICAVIPAYNNEDTIETVVATTRAYLEPVVVIDDGSTDGTSRAAERAGARVVRVSRNTGKGNALRLGFHDALSRGYDAVITLDADLQHDPGDIPKFTAYYHNHGANIIVGNRMVDKDSIPAVRRIPNMVGMYLFSLLIGQPIEDSQSGFRLYDRTIMETIPVVRDGFDAEADILLRAGKRGYAIAHVPIRTVYFEKGRHRSSYRPVKDTFHISITFLKNLFWKER
jgi:glycosyltransferase involved in cell wall biosynthesis